jgi:hypothetical protein
MGGNRNAHRIDPTVDFACKLLLGNPEYPDITIHFLNAILRLPSPIRLINGCTSFDERRVRALRSC